MFKVEIKAAEPEANPHVFVTYPANTEEKVNNREMDPNDTEIDPGDTEMNPNAFEKNRNDREAQAKKASS